MSDPMLDQISEMMLKKRAGRFISLFLAIFLAAGSGWGDELPEFSVQYLNPRTGESGTATMTYCTPSRAFFEGETFGEVLLSRMPPVGIYGVVTPVFLGYLWAHLYSWRHFANFEGGPAVMATMASGAFAPLALDMSLNLLRYGGARLRPAAPGASLPTLSFRWEQFVPLRHWFENPLSPHIVEVIDRSGRVWILFGSSRPPLTFQGLVAASRADSFYYHRSQGYAWGWKRLNPSEAFSALSEVSEGRITPFMFHHEFARQYNPPLLQAVQNLDNLNSRTAGTDFLLQSLRDALTADSFLNIMALTHTLPEVQREVVVRLGEGLVGLEFRLDQIRQLAYVSDPVAREMVAEAILRSSRTPEFFLERAEALLPLNPGQGIKNSLFHFFSLAPDGERINALLNRLPQELAGNAVAYLLKEMRTPSEFIFRSKELSLILEPRHHFAIPEAISLCAQDIARVGFTSAEINSLLWEQGIAFTEGQRERLLLAFVNSLGRLADLSRLRLPSYFRRTRDFQTALRSHSVQNASAGLRHSLCSQLIYWFGF